MSTTLAFRDQIALLTNWFDGWNRCEQTVALVSLLRRLSWIQARFFRSFIEHICENVAASVTEEQRQRFEAAERCANDASHIVQLCTDLAAQSGLSESAAAERVGLALLDYVLLLDATNAEVKQVYFEQVARLLAVSARGEPNASLIDICRQLLSSILIHPALSVAERQTILLWLAQYGQAWERPVQRTGNTAREEEHVRCDETCEEAESGLESSCKRESTLADECDIPRRALADDMLCIRDGREITDLSAISALSDPLAMLSMCTTRQAAAMTSLCSTSALESTDSSAFWSQLGTTSSSACVPAQADLPKASEAADPSQSANEERLQDGKKDEGESRARERDIAVWLKMLRLHKYAPIFETLSFEELPGVTDEFLEQKGVTRGARRKLLAHIEKLAQRGRTLRELELEIVRANAPGCFLKQALDTIEQILVTPIRAYRADSESDSAQTSKLLESTDDKTVSDARGNFTKATNMLFSQSVPDDDLATLITRALGKIHTQLLLSVGGRIDETLAARYVALADRCCQHEAFDATHRDLLSSWRTQISDKVPLQRCKAVLLQPLALKSAAKQLKGLAGKTQLAAGSLSSTHPPMFFPLGFQPNMNVSFGASPYYTAQASGAPHATVQHRNSLPIGVPTADACAFVQQGNLQQLLAAGNVLPQPAISQMHTPNNLHGQSVWRSWASASGSHAISMQPFTSVSQASPALTPSSGSAMSSQLSLNSDVGNTLPPRRGSCDVPVGSKGVSATFLSGFALDTHGNDRNNNVSLPPIALASGSDPLAAAHQHASVANMRAASQKRRFERTNSAPNQAALFARLRQTAPVNTGSAFTMSATATIREQPSVDQDDAPDGPLHVHAPPLRSDVSQVHGKVLDASESERELERLDSLCMRVTEAALDG